MNLHEYQAKELLKSYGVPTLPGYLAYTTAEAEKAAVNLGSGVCVVKAQVHAGGRGKGGGVKLAKSPSEAASHAGEILGMHLVTPQTSAEGKLVRKVWVEAGANIAKEFYLSILVDRAACAYQIVASPEGGMDIEEVAEKTPEKILNVEVAFETGLQPFHGRKIASFLGLDKAQGRKFAPCLKSFFDAFVGIDASMLEVNPLILTAEEDFYCLDAKVAIDENALYRQRRCFEFMDFRRIA
ncbi:UNVERIFIED_CONTAM: hypothetical protein GTU68_002550 [Idotea baltica]|nr:hypothetical protein [Idotea baltica]